jgi:hypothetical protein
MRASPKPSRRTERHRRPKTGERRRHQCPLRIDRLPLALLDRIRTERAKGRTWDEIERDSPQWPEWEQASPAVLADFPGRRLPHTNVQRWHDLRVEQVQRERDARAEAAHAFAGRLAARGVPHLYDAVRNALGDSVFRLALEGTDEQLIRDELCRLAQVLSGMARWEVARRKVDLDYRKHELAAQQAEVDWLLAQNKMTPAEMKQFLHGLTHSPAFDSYFATWAKIAAAREAADAEADDEGPQDDKPEPGNPPEPEDAPPDLDAFIKRYSESPEVLVKEMLSRLVPNGRPSSPPPACEPDGESGAASQKPEAENQKPEDRSREAEAEDRESEIEDRGSEAEDQEAEGGPDSDSLPLSSGFPANSQSPIAVLPAISRENKEEHSQAAGPQITRSPHPAIPRHPPRKRGRAFGGGRLQITQLPNYPIFRGIPVASSCRGLLPWSWSGKRRDSWVNGTPLRLPRWSPARSTWRTWTGPSLRRPCRRWPVPFLPTLFV